MHPNEPVFTERTPDGHIIPNKEFVDIALDAAVMGPGYADALNQQFVRQTDEEKAREDARDAAR